MQKKKLTPKLVPLEDIVLESITPTLNKEQAKEPAN